jgi:glycosyltransferase involved in cell wall biosynthesis
MRILAVTLRYPPYTAGGYELLTEDAVEGLRERGHEVLVLAGAGTRFEDVRVRPLLLPSLDPERDLFDDDRVAGPRERMALHFFRRANFRATKRVLRELRPDLVLYFNLGLASLAPLVAASLAGVPRLGYICDRWVENHWLRTMAKQSDKAGRLALLRPLWHALRKRAGLAPILTASEWLRERLLADGLAAGDVRVLATGLSPKMDALASAGEPRVRAQGERLRIVSSSMLWRGKGQHVLVEAFGRAVAEGLDAELVVAGKDTSGEDYLGELQGLAAEARVTDRVAFIGQLSPEELSAELFASHVFVLPSIWGEPFGLATIEAMAHGLATVVSDSGASPELVGAAGIVVPTGEISALTRTLLELGGDEERRRELGVRARELALTQYSREAFLDALEAEAEALV